MITLYVVVEGRTEERFVKSVLDPHLRAYNKTAIPIVVETSRDRSGRKRGGGGDWTKWYGTLWRLMKEQSRRDVFFTTLFDLYGLPKKFPKLAEYAGESDTRRRAEALEGAMKESLGEWRLVPYLQRHEFEALVLASLDELETVLDVSNLEGLAALRQEIGTRAPEEINDGQASAPSKRLKKHITGYRKTFHGPLAVKAAGLTKLRLRCLRFDAWITSLERWREDGAASETDEISPTTGGIAPEMDPT